MASKIKHVEVWETSDGQQFTTEKAAVQRQAEIDILKKLMPTRSYRDWTFQERTLLNKLMQHYSLSEWTDPV